MAISVELKREVAERAANCCEYCKSQLKYLTDSFSVEHIVPRSSEGSDDETNLALACQGCNGHKFTAIEAIDPLTGRTSPLFHPPQHRWNDHFAWSDDLTVVLGISATGRASVNRLQLHREGVVNLRRILREAGEHPPKV